MSETEREELQAQTKLLEIKVEMERKNKTVIGNINEYAFIRSDKTQAQATQPEAKAAAAPEIVEKYDWYQNATHVFVTFKVKGDKELAKNTMVAFTSSSVGLEGSNGQNIML